MSGLWPRAGRPSREHQRERQMVLEALAEVGPLGMTPNALGVSTDVPESRLRNVIARLIDAGLVCRRGRTAAEAIGYLQGDLLLLTKYARPKA